MGKTKKKSKNFIEKIAAILLIVFCGCFLVGCVGGNAPSSSGSSGSSGSNSGSATDKDEIDNPYRGSIDSIIDDYNQVFMGGIGVYEVDTDAAVFADNYTGNNVDFNFLIDRQFNTLATVLYQSLDYAYGSNNFSVTFDNYTTTGAIISLAETDIIQSKVYNNESMLYYPNAMNGGYKMIVTETAEQDTNPDGTPMEDGEGNPIYKLSFSYGSELNTDKKWKQIPTKESILSDLKYIYKNIQEPSDMSEINLSDNKLKTYYSGSQFAPIAVENNAIKTIGLSQAYMWNVLYYLAYSVIGSTNIEDSNNARSYVVNGNTINDINRLNYTKFEQYKGYDTILLEIVTNAFKLVKDGNNIKVSSNYSYSAIDWERTLFPNMARYQFVYYEDIDDIRDAEFTGADSDREFDPNARPLDKDEFDYESDEDFDIENIEVKSEKVELGSARKLKEIIYLPQYTNSFEVSMLSIAFVRAKDVANGTSVQMYTNIYGTKEDKKPIYSGLVDIDDGTYRVELPGGVVIEGGDASECEYLAKDIDDALIIEYEESSGKGESAKNRVMANVFANAKSEDYLLSNVAIDGVTQSESDIKKSFTQSNYTCAKNEEITAYNLNVCNNIVALDSSGNYSLNLQNVISFQFKYYDSNNQEIDIPLLYLMSFRFM